MPIVRCGFLGLGSGCCKTRRLDRSTVVRTIVVHVEIVGMRPWNWVLQLLLLLLLRVSVASATFVVKLATCVVTGPSLRAKESRYRQKTPEACTEGVTRAFF